jgi:hypothetical protein
VRGIDTLRRQICRHALCALLRQIHVVLTAAGAVGITDDLDHVLVVLLQRTGQVVQRRVETAGNRGRVGGEGNVARHHQLDGVALTLNFNTGVSHAGAQRGFLLVCVVTVTCGACTHDSGTDQCALATVVVVDGGTGNGTGQRPQTPVFGGLAHAAGILCLPLIVIRIL